MQYRPIHPCDIRPSPLARLALLERKIVLEHFDAALSRQIDRAISADPSSNGRAPS